MTLILYFAFGSNMLTHRLLARVESAQLIGPAEAAGWRLRFRKRGADGSGKCDLCLSPEPQSVTGVLFRLDEDGPQRLDGFEGPGYRRQRIRLSHRGQEIEAITYRAEPSHLSSELRPYDWYLQLVIAGLIEHQVDADQVEQVRRTPWIPDPNPNRPARLQALAALRAFHQHNPKAARLLIEHEAI